MPSSDRRSITIQSPVSVVVVVCLPRPMEGMGDSNNFQIFSHKYQFHHRQLESLEHD